MKKAAKQAAKDAKKADRLGRNSSGDEEDLGDVYDKYIFAYNAYCDVTQYIESSMPSVARVAHQDIRRTIFSVLGWIIAFAVSIFGVWLALRG